MDPAQGEGPIPLDQEAMGRQIQTWIQEEAQSHNKNEDMEGEQRSEGSTAPAEEQTEKGKERSKRARTKPSWLRDFVRMERS